MGRWTCSAVSIASYLWFAILECAALLLTIALAPIWRPPQLRDAGKVLRDRRRKSFGTDDCTTTEDGQLHQKILAGKTPSSPNDVSDLGRRYLDFVAQEVRLGRVAATTAPRRFIDISAYDEVIVTTKWEADGFLACCMLFAAFTAEARRTAEVSKDGQARHRPYPLRTVIVGEGRTGVKAAKARQALSLMREAGILPVGCEVGVYEGSGGPTEAGDASTTSTEDEARLIHHHGPKIEDGETRRIQESFLSSVARRACNLLLRRDLREKSGIDRLREVLRGSGRGEQRVLIVAMKPPRDLVKALLEKKKGWGRLQWGGGEEFDNVDLLISKSFSGVMEEPERGVRKQPEGALDVDEAMRKLHRVFVVQLDDLVSSYGFPKTIAPDRTPTLSAAMAGAGGILPSCLRELVATSNRALLTQFPDKVAAAILAGRYGNDKLRCRASEIAEAVKSEPNAGRARLVELGACMADLVACDFEPLEAAALSPGTHQAVFRSLDVGMSLNDACLAWALTCQDQVYWQYSPRLTADEACLPLGARRIASLCSHGDGSGAMADGEISDEILDDKYSGELAAAGTKTFNGWELVHHDNETYRGGQGVFGGVEIGTCGVCNKACCERGSQTACSCSSKELKLKGGTAIKQCGREERRHIRRREGFRGFLSTGFADGAGERLEDQEAGYATFVRFLERVLDQMP